MSRNAGSEEPRTAGISRPLRILHVMRAPVGGLFRHVVDLARGQAEAGHAVGIIADATTGAERAEAILAALAPALSLGVLRIPMRRHPGPGDYAAVRQVGRYARACATDVVHGHGAKGGAYARLTHERRTIRVYTPHGGSLHYRRTSPLGFVYLGLERLLMPRTELFLFESAYGRDAFRARVGQARAPTRVVHNGVGPGEFEPVLPDGDASDLLYIGELRRLKGVDVLVEALAALHAHGRKVTLTFVGAGPDAETLRARVAELGLHGFVRFAGVLAARAAFTRGRLLIVPSRAESLPYVVLEAAAASVPMIATNVGGIPEIFGPQAAALIPPGRPDLLAGSIEAALDDFDAARARAATLRERVAEWFSAPAMVAGVLAGYRDALSLNPHFLGSG